MCVFVYDSESTWPGQASSDLVRMMSTPFGVSCLCSNNSPSCECLFSPVLVVCVHGRYLAGRLGLVTCYDVRFPEMFVELRRRGAEVVLVPSAFTVPTGRAHWHVLLRSESFCVAVAVDEYHVVWVPICWCSSACLCVSLSLVVVWAFLTQSVLESTGRAIETQCYVLAAAQYGRHNTKRESYGHSIAIDPWGVVASDAGGMDSGSDEIVDPPPSIVVYDIDLESVASVRQRMPIEQHREAAGWV